MKKKRFAALVLAMALMLTSLAGCGNSKDTGSAASNAGSDGAPAASALSVCLGPEPASMDPALNTTVDGGSTISHFFEGLTKLDKDGKTYVNGQAKDIQVSEDGLTYTVTLRDDIKWSDGQPVKASDFIYAWQRAVSPKTAAEYAYMFDMIKNAAKITADEEKDATKLGAVAKDDKTIVITLEAPCTYFKELLAFPAFFPVRKDVVEGNDAWTQKPETYISNGAYKLKAWNHKESIVAEKNPNYYDASKIVSNTINFVLLEDDAAMLTAYQNGEVSLIDRLPVDEYATWKEQPDWHSDAQLGTYLVAFQTEKAPFNDKRVRKALSLAIDREYIVNNIDTGGNTPATGMVSYGVIDQDNTKQFRDVGGNYWDASSAAYEKNVAEAKKLLAEAGYPDGKGFPTFEYMFNSATNHQAIAEALQNMWKTELGIDATLSGQEWSVFTDTRHKGQYQVARHGWLADYNDPVSYLDLWVTGAGNNDAKWSNKEYDSLIAKAKSTADQKVRMEAMHKAEDILMDELPVAPVYFYSDPYLLKTDVTGFYDSPLGFKFFFYAKQGA